METKNYKRHTVTAALPYANGGLHIGHLAGVYIPADIYVRYLRSKGEEVLFVCGSDEHGVPVTIRAEKEGLTVQEVVDKYHHLIKQSFEDFGIAFDIYSRTSNKIHYETASDFFKVLYEKGKFLEKTEDQYFDPIKNRFLADRYIRGECPVCANPEAYGDQCEKCGSTLSPKDLINPRSFLSDAIPVLKPSKQWYLPLDEYETWLQDWILKGHQADWKANVYGQCKSWIDAGLQPRAMTRDLDWGIPVPLPDTEGKVLYVWFDAPIGYISATKEYFEQNPNTPLAQKYKSSPFGGWGAFWKSEDTKLVHFIGKDNIVFHCIIFPIMLHAHGDFIVPENVPANEFLNLEDDKISTSRNWAVWLDEYLVDLPQKQDALRYCLTANAPETKDNNFTWKDFQDRNNNELVAIYGNFVNRVIVLTEKYFEGKVPDLGELNDIDKILLADLQAFPAKIGESIGNYRFREALSIFIDLARTGNKYLQDNAPWTLYKQGFEENKARIATILHLGLQITANLAILGEPFLPFASAKIRSMLNISPFTWQDAGRIDLIQAGQIVKNEGLLFEKIEDEVVEQQLNKLLATKQAKKQNQTETKEVEEIKPIEAQKPEIIYDDFGKIDIRVATVLQAEKVKNADRLLKLTLDTGIDTRTVVSGIAEHYSPEEMVGKQVCILVNLAPRKLKGIESQGMILTAEDQNGKLRLIRPEEVVGAGSVVK
jgi:methionyl-tRNA synthetase